MPENEFRICPNCGYGRGFHVSLKKAGDGYSVVLICPECGSAWDIGLIEERIKILEPRKDGEY